MPAVMQITPEWANCRSASLSCRIRVVRASVPVSQARVFRLLPIMVASPGLQCCEGGRAAAKAGG